MGEHRGKVCREHNKNPESKMTDEEEFDKIVSGYLMDMTRIAQICQHPDGIAEGMLAIRRHFLKAYKLGLSKGQKIRFEMVQIN